MNGELISDFSSAGALHSEQIHLRDYLNIIWRRKWIVVVFFLIVVAVVAFKTRNTKPEYAASTRIFIEKGSSFMGMMAKVETDPRVQSFSGTQEELLMSRGLAREVIDSLGLEEYIDSLKDEKPGYFKLLQRKFKKTVNRFTAKPRPRSGISGNQKAQTLNKGEKGVVLEKQDRAVDWYLSKLDIMPVAETSLFDIGFSCGSPLISARVANKHSEIFIENNIKVRRLVSTQALEWIKTQIKEHKVNVDLSMRKVNVYKYRKLTPEKVKDGSAFATKVFSEDPVVRELYRNLTALRIQKAELASKFGPKYPKIVEVSSSIKRLEQEMGEEVMRVRMTIKAELDRAQSVDGVARQVEGIDKSYVDANDNMVDGDNDSLDLLKLEAESDQALYDILIKQAKELSLTGDMEKNNIRIVDKAEVPGRPSVPNVFMNFIMSVVLGLAFGVGLAFFFEYMDKTIKTPNDIKQFLGTPVLGMLPYDRLIRKGKPVLQLENTNGKKRKGYDYGRYDISGNLSTCLSPMQSKTLGQVFIVQSATAGEGKTSVVAKSAINLAMGGARVLMVDADFLKPSLHRLFDLENKSGKGLSNVMEDIMLHELKQGTLDKCSVGDIFFLIGLKRHSGQLLVRSDNQAMTAFFDKGRLFNLQSQDVPFANRLGTMLLRGGFIDESQLKDSLERNQRTGQPLGYILINAGYINQDQLQGPLKLQMEEHLQKLFSWKHGTFDFEHGSIETYEDKRIYFQEDYKPIINRLGRISETRLLERDIFSYVQNLNEPNLSLLPAGIPNARPVSSVYFLSIMEKCLHVLRDNFDVVLLDAPPILETMCSASPLFSIVDGVIFVAKSGHVSVKQILEAGDHLKKANANVIGTILNQVKVGKKHDSNSYAYYT